MGARDLSPLERWRAGRDADSFAEIISRHSSMVYATCKRVVGNSADAEDVAQQCFLELMQTRLKIRSLASWLHTTAVRRSIDLIRADTRRRQREIGSVQEKHSDREVDMNALMASIDDAIAQLPERFREPMILRFLEGQGYEEIAGTLGVAQSTVRYRVNKGIERVRTILTRSGIQVTTAVLAGTFGAQMVEAAPATLTAALGKLALASSADAAGRVAASAASAHQLTSGRGSVRSMFSEAAVVGGIATKLKVLAAPGAAALILVILALQLFQRDPSSHSPPIETSASQPTVEGGIGERPRLEVEVVWEESLEPVAGVAVTLRHPADPQAGSTEATTGAEGRAELPYPSGWGEGKLEARYVRAVDHSVDIELPPPGAVNVGLRPFVVTGVVRDSETDEPLPGVLIRVADDELETDANGLFTLTGPAKGQHSVTASLAGYADKSTFLSIGEEHVRLDMELDRVLETRCVDGEGEPVAGAEVYLVEHVERATEGKDGNPKPAMMGPVATDERGIAGFRGVPSGDGVWQITVYAVLPDHLAGLIQESVNKETGMRSAGSYLEVVLAEAIDVVGVVVVPEDFDPGNVTIRAESLHFQDSAHPFERQLSTSHAQHGHLWPHLFERQADAQGRFAFHGLPSDAWIHLKATAPGLGETRTRVDRSRRGRAVTMELLPEGALEGTLVFEDSGRPADGIAVVATSTHAGSFSAVVDAQGRFRITGLPEAIYDLTLAHGFDRSEWTMAVRRSVKVVAGQTSAGHHLELERGAIVSGTVSDAVSGEPIPRASISAVMGPNVGTAWTDAEGRYSLRLPRGKSKLYLSSQLTDYEYPRDQASTEVIVAQGESRKDGIDFSLMPRRQPRQNFSLGRVRGRVLGSDGRPLADVRVRTFTLHDPDHPFRSVFNRAALTDARGQYELLALAGPVVYLEAGGNRYSTAQVTFQIAADQIHEVEDLVVHAGSSSIAGRVVDAEGQPLSGVHVAATSKSKRGGSEPTRTDRQGRFRLEFLVRDEPLRVSLSKPGYSNREWSGVAPGTEDLRFVMHELEGGRYRHTGDKNPRDPKTLMGERAPAWDVAQWIQAPAAPRRPDRGDGRGTLLIFAWSRQELEELGPGLRSVEEKCERAGIVPVVILRCDAHESTIRPVIEAYDLKLGVGVDRFVPKSEYRTNCATGPTYGYAYSGEDPLVFLIDSSGTVRRVQRKLDHVDELLGLKPDTE